MSIIKRVTHPASLSFVNLILALGSVPTVALSSSTRKSRIMIPVGICSCQCTIIPERVFNLGGITDQFVRNKWSTSPVSVVFQNGIFKYDDDMKKELSEKLAFFRDSLISGDFPVAEKADNGPDPCRYCKYGKICGRIEKEGADE